LFIDDAAERIPFKFFERPRSKTFIASPFCYMILVTILMKDQGIDIELPNMLANIAHNACGE
jgi:hypothetical protein